MLGSAATSTASNKNLLSCTDGTGSGQGRPLDSLQKQLGAWPPSDLALYHAQLAMAPWQPQTVAATMAQPVVRELGAGHAPDTATTCPTTGSQYGYVLSSAACHDIHGHGHI